MNRGPIKRGGLLDEKALVSVAGFSNIWKETDKRPDKNQMLERKKNSKNDKIITARKIKKHAQREKRL